MSSLPCRVDRDPDQFRQNRQASLLDLLHGLSRSGKIIAVGYPFFNIGGDSQSVRVST